MACAGSVQRQVRPPLTPAGGHAVLQNAAVHHDLYPGSLGPTCGTQIDDVFLQPQIRNSQPDYIVHNRRNVFRSAKDIDQLNLAHRSLCRIEIGVGPFSQRILDPRIYRHNPVAPRLHKARYAERCAARVIAEADNRNRPAVAENFLNDRGFVHRKLIQIVSRIDSDRNAAVAAHLQITANKWVDVTVQHPVHIANLNFGAVVLRNAVGLQHVGAYL